jgi:hypothetical protein
MQGCGRWLYLGKNAVQTDKWKYWRAISKLAQQKVPILERLFQNRMVCAGKGKPAVSKFKIFSHFSKAGFN